MDMSVQKYSLQPHEPTAVLHEVIYQIEVLVATSITGTSDTLINVALLESRLLHTKNLIDFFEKTRHATPLTFRVRVGDGEALAQEYGFPARTVAMSDQDKQRLNKAVAFMTHERNRYRLLDDMYWLSHFTLLPLLIRCKEFVEYLLTQYPLEKEEYRDRLERLLRRVQTAIRLSETG
jgi:hypothetical protein